MQPADRIGPGGLSAPGQKIVFLKAIAESAQEAGYPVAIKVYPGAYHSFDSYNPVRYIAERVNANAPSGRGATTGGDPKAWTDSIHEVVAFFGQHLK